MYQLPHVVNAILHLAREEKIDITPMKLQKLLYFIYKEYYQNNNEPMFSERFEPWAYGPVLTDVYYAYKKSKANAIKDYCRDAEGKLQMLRMEMLPDVEQAVMTTWRRYKDYSGIALSGLTHQDNSAWRKAVQNDFPFLQDEDIKTEPLLTPGGR